MMKISIQEWLQLNHELQQTKVENNKLNQILANSKQSFSTLLTKKSYIKCPEQNQPQKQKSCADKNQQNECRGNYSQLNRTDQKNKGLNRQRDSLAKGEVILGKKVGKLNLVSSYSENCDIQRKNLEVATKINLFKNNGIQNHQIIEHQNKSSRSTKIGRPSVLNCSLQNQLPQTLKLIQNICLIGPKEEQIKDQLAKNKIYTPSSILYCSHSPSCCTCQQFLPNLDPQEGVSSSRVRTQNTAGVANQIIFSKIFDKYECPIFLFEKQDLDKNKVSHELHEYDWVLKRINARRRLAMLCIKFEDFVYVQNQIAMPLSPVTFNKNILLETEKQLLPGLEISRKARQGQQKKYFVKSTYTLCLFTYFPFINLMQHILSSLINQIKIQRIRQYKKCQSFHETSIKNFIFHLSRLSASLNHQCQQLKIRKSEQLKLSIGNQNILFNFCQEKINRLIYDGWCETVLSKFNNKSAYQLVVAIMSGKFVCFACQDEEFLTKAVYFFVAVVMGSFGCTCPVITRAMSFQYLNIDFPMVVGFKETTKWITENMSINCPNRIFVDLNGKQATIMKNKQIALPKCEKLKKIFDCFYRHGSSFSFIPQYFTRKRRSSMCSTSTESSNTIPSPTIQTQQKSDILAKINELISAVENLFKSQLISHIPNKQIVKGLRQVSVQLNEETKKTFIFEYVRKFVLESMKSKGAVEQLFEGFVKGSIFEDFMSEYYQL